MSFQRMRDLGLEFDVNSIRHALAKHAPDDLEYEMDSATGVFRASSESQGFITVASSRAELLRELAYTLWFS